ncbi:hypothetical protein [Clostridium tertium]|uniref:hypothetical protein n=1 Tax=Clostridium tertium TaxID=1559 RepID=UPI0023B2C2BF|nr:hypothetical protein [Clostridium tertium]
MKISKNDLLQLMIEQPGDEIDIPDYIIIDKRESKKEVYNSRLDVGGLSMPEPILETEPRVVPKNEVYDSRFDTGGLSFPEPDIRVEVDGTYDEPIYYRDNIDSKASPSKKMNRNLDENDDMIPPHIMEMVESGYIRDKMYAHVLTRNISYIDYLKKYHPNLYMDKKITSEVKKIVGYNVAYMPEKKFAEKGKFIYKVDLFKPLKKHAKYYNKNNLLEQAKNGECDDLIKYVSERNNCTLSKIPVLDAIYCLYLATQDIDKVIYALIRPDYISNAVAKSGYTNRSTGTELSEYCFEADNELLELKYELTGVSYDPMVYVMVNILNELRQALSNFQNSDEQLIYLIDQDYKEKIEYMNKLKQYKKLDSIISLIYHINRGSITARDELIYIKTLKRAVKLLELNIDTNNILDYSDEIMRECENRLNAIRKEL